MKKFTAYFLVLIIFTACNPVMYAPTAFQVPLFEEKGEVSITAAYHDLDHGDGHGLNLQFAAAVDSSLAFTFTFNQFSDTNESQDKLLNDAWRSSGTYWEAGVGTFGFFHPSSKFKYELYGGIGYGNAKNVTSKDKISNSVLKPYFQPNIGISGKYLEIAVSTRFALVSFMNTTNITSDPELSRYVNDFFNAKQNTVVFEPGFTLRGGNKNLKVQFQYSTTSFQHKDRHGSIFGYADDYMNLGLTYMISKRYDR